MPKNWCFQNAVLEKTLQSPLDWKEIQPVNPKGNQPWIFIGRTDAEAETPILWPPDVKNQLLGKDPDAGKDWRREEKGTEDEIVGWSLTRWTWVWLSSGSWWWTGKPGVLQSMGSQRVGHDWGTELNWTDITWSHYIDEEVLCLPLFFFFSIDTLSICSRLQNYFYLGFEGGTWTLMKMAELGPRPFNF